MTEFNWTYQESEPIKLRTFIMGYGVTRTLLKKIKFHGGQTLVNGQAVLVNHMLKAGDQVKLVLPPEPANDHLQTSFEPITIVYEDDNFLIVNKPAGIASVPSHIYSNDSLVNRVKGYYQKQNYANQKVHIATRLDRDTSGLVIFAKHHFAHSVLDKQLKEHSIQKEYLTIVENRVRSDHFEVFLPIGRDDDSFVKRTIRDDGKMADTECWVVKQLANHSVLKVRLHTGRTHQIRVHMAAIGHPLIGDWLYNETNTEMQRQALHCYRVKFYDPYQQQTIDCQAPLTSDMQTFVNKH